MALATLGAVRPSVMEKGEASEPQGALPGALVGLVGVAGASWLLRVHPQPR